MGFGAVYSSFVCVRAVSCCGWCFRFPTQIWHHLQRSEGTT